MQTAKNRTGKTWDMTEGSPLGIILRFAVPLFIGGVFQQLYSIVDTMVVGYRLGDASIAAMGATTSIFTLIINIATGFNNGCGVVVTQAFGSHDDKRLRQSIAGMFIINAISTVLLTALSVLFVDDMMRYMAIPADIFGEAYTYIFIICCGLAATTMYNMFASIMRSVGNSRAPLVFLIISSVIHIVLVIVLVVYYGLGVAGAAFSTVISQAISALLSGVYVFRNYKDLLPKREDYRVPGELYGNLITLGISMTLMLVVVDLGSIIIQKTTNALGAAMITAYAASRRIIFITMQPLGSVATGAATFVAQNYGAGKLQRIKLAIKKVISVQLVWSVVSFIAVFFVGKAFMVITTGTSDPDVVAGGYYSMLVHHAFYWALGVLFTLRNSMQSMEMKVAPVLASVIELTMKFLSAQFVIPSTGYLGICATEPITWVAMMIFLLISYLVKTRKLFGADKVVSE